MRSLTPTCVSVLFACTSLPTFSAAPTLDAAVPASDGGAGASDAGSGDSARADVAVDAGGRKYGLFVTSASKAGSFFGTRPATSPADAANLLCSNLASDAGYSGAWIGLIRVKDAPLPKELVGSTRGGWFQTTGAGRYGDQVLTDLRDDARTSTSILTEKGDQAPTDAWTGGSLSGLGPSDNCDNWKDPDAGGVSGSVADPQRWMENSGAGALVSCSLPLSIYCVEMPVPR